MKRIAILIASASVAFTSFLAVPARADCSNPQGIEGDQIYNSSCRMMQFCDGVDWKAMGELVLPCNITTPRWIVAAGLVATIGVADTLSVVVTATDDGGPPAYSKVSGDAWISINPTTGQLTGTPPGVGTYTITARATDIDTNTADRMFTVQVNATSPPPACPNIGDVCPDGSIFAGISPDGNKYMYVARCDANLTWNGTICTGGTTVKPWNNGANTGWVVTGQAGLASGELNTNNMVGIDSDTGAGGSQPHRAAQTCYDLNEQGQTDWYLPAYNELLVIYTNLQGTSNLANTVYWSSSEADSTRSLSLNFSSGTGVWDYKNGASAVRCARTD